MSKDQLAERAAIVSSSHGDLVIATLTPDEIDRLYLSRHQEETDDHDDRRDTRGKPCVARNGNAHFSSLPIACWYQARMVWASTSNISPSAIFFACSAFAGLLYSSSRKSCPQKTDRRTM